MSHPRLRRTAVVAAAVVPLSLLVGCSGGSDDPDSPQSSDGPSSDQPASVTLTAKAFVEGAPRFKAQRQQLARDIGDVISAYVESAYLGAEGDPFAGFTRGAAEKATGDLDLVTGAAYDGAESVRASTLRSRVSVVAPEQGPVGATAFVRFVIETDDATWTYRGRLFLTPQGDDWKIFGYDLKASDR